MNPVSANSVAQYSLACIVLTVLCMTSYAHHDTSAPAGSTGLRVTMGMHNDGTPTDAWIDAIRVFHDDVSLQAVRANRNVMSETDRQWEQLIRKRAPEWETRVNWLNIPFDTTPPGDVVIILGNAGGNDAFVYKTETIAFDVRRLNEIYGPATSAENQARIDRFFNHEFTHLLHKAWRFEHALELRTPLETALWVCLKEGVGNYYSLSARWTNGDGTLSAHSEATLARLSPIFVERLAALATAADEDVQSLMQGLSMGPFQDKWGALPIALWLTQETRGDPQKLKPWVSRGPWGILELAHAYLPADLAEQLPAKPDSGIPHCAVGDVRNSPVTQAAIDDFEKIRKNDSRQDILDAVGQPSYLCGSGIHYDVYRLADGRSVWIAYEDDVARWAFVESIMSDQRSYLFGD